MNTHSIFDLYSGPISNKNRKAFKNRFSSLWLYSCDSPAGNIYKRFSDFLHKVPLKDFRFLTSHIGGQEAGRRPAPAPPEYTCAQAAPSTRPEADKEAARRTCWLGIPKIELSVFVPGPWVVFGASPERRFSHAASTALERLPPVKIIRLPW